MNSVTMMIIKYSGHEAQKKTHGDDAIKRVEKLFKVPSMFLPFTSLSLYLVTAGQSRQSIYGHYRRLLSDIQRQRFYCSY